MAPITVVEGIETYTEQLIISNFDGTADALSDPSTPQYQALQWVTDRKIEDTVAVYTDARVLQQYSLATLYYSTNGESAWNRSDGWLSTTTECEWYGVECSQEEGGSEDSGLVVGLNLTDNGLDGTLPSDLVLLSASLTVVDLSNNNLPGTTPSEIGELTLLNGLFLSEIHVADIILPTTISGLTKLLHMNLSLNSPSSLIPSEIGNMLSLQWLRLGSNALKGKVPTEMGTLGAELTHLDMATNNLFYELPSEIGKLIRLKEMLVQDNKLAAGGAATT